MWRNWTQRRRELNYSNSCYFHLLEEPKKKKKNVRSSVTSFSSFGQKWLHVNVSSNCLWQRLGETFSISSMQNLFNWALFEEFRACSFTTPSSILIGFRSQLRLNIVLWIIILLESSRLQLWLLSRWPRVLHTHVLIWWFDDLMIWWPGTRLQQLHLWPICLENQGPDNWWSCLDVFCRLQSFSPGPPAEQVKCVRRLLKW